MKAPITFAVLSILVLVFGCGKSVNLVKDETLEGYEETTVGDAFNAVFNEAEWVLNEMENKTLFVEFTGKAKKPMQMDTKGVFVIPQNGKVLVQFTLKKDDTFEITYAESVFVVSPALKKVLPPGGEKELEILLAFSGIKLDGTTPNAIKDLEMFLDTVYGK